MRYELLVAKANLLKAQRAVEVALHKAEQEAYRWADEQRAVRRKESEEMRLFNLYVWNYREEYQDAIHHWQRHEDLWWRESLKQRERERELIVRYQAGRMGEMEAELAPFHAHESECLVWYWQEWKQHKANLRKQRRPRRPRLKKVYLEEISSEICRASDEWREQYERQLISASCRRPQLIDWEESGSSFDDIVRAMEDAYN